MGVNAYLFLPESLLFKAYVGGNSEKTPFFDRKTTLFQAYLGAI